MGMEGWQWSLGKEASLLAVVSSHILTLLVYTLHHLVLYVIPVPLQPTRVDHRWRQSRECWTGRHLAELYIAHNSIYIPR